MIVSPNEPHQENLIMDARPRTKASRKRRAKVKADRKAKKWASKVMPMLSHPKKKKVMA